MLLVFLDFQCELTIKDLKDENGECKSRMQRKCSVMNVTSWQICVDIRY